MEERRHQLLAQISEDHRHTAILILSEVDVRLEEKASEMRTEVTKRLGEVVGTCEDRFVEVIQILKDGETERALALKENTLISQAAVEASIANGIAIQALADKIPLTIAAENGVKKSGKFIGWLFAALKRLGVQIGILGEWAKKAFIGLATVIAMIILPISMWQGHITFADLKAIAIKILGE